MSPRKRDIRIQKLVEWNDFANVPAQQSLPSIYNHAEEVSKHAREWYWRSVGNKRIASLAVRGVGFTLLIIGAIAPLAAGLSSDVEFRLASTQLGVMTLAVAGLLVPDVMAGAIAMRHASLLEAR